MSWLRFDLDTDQWPVEQMCIVSCLNAVAVGYVRTHCVNCCVMLVLPCAEIFFEKEWIECMIYSKSLVSLWMMIV